MTTSRSLRCRYVATCLFSNFFFSRSTRPILTYRTPFYHSLIFSRSLVSKLYFNDTINNNDDDNDENDETKRINSKVTGEVYQLNNAVVILLVLLLFEGASRSFPLSLFTVSCNRKKISFTLKNVYTLLSNAINLRNEIIKAARVKL